MVSNLLMFLGHFNTLFGILPGIRQSMYDRGIARIQKKGGRVEKASARAYRMKILMLTMPQLYHVIMVNYYSLNLDLLFSMKLMTSENVCELKTVGSSKLINSSMLMSVSL